jgi:phage terminase large subunit-like protein
MIAAGVPMIEFPQNVAAFSEPMKHLDGVFIAGRIHHTGGPILRWAIGNVVAKKDAKENVYTRKAQEQTRLIPPWP